jgi:hypothetical protein
VLSLSSRLATAPAPPPTLSLGTLGKNAQQAKKPVTRAKAAAKTKAGEDDYAALLEAGDSSIEDPLVMEDPMLRLIVAALGSCPRCFDGLLPWKVLLNGERPGHQLRGARVAPKHLQFYHVLGVVSFHWVQVWFALSIEAK